MESTVTSLSPQKSTPTGNSNGEAIGNNSVKDMTNHPSFGAAFSLASLDQGNSRGSLSCMNLNAFDTGVFLKSGSFDCLNQMLGSQFFKDPGQIQVNLNDVKNIGLPIATQTTSPSLAVPSLPPSTSPNGGNSSGTTGGSSINLKSYIPTSIPSNVISTSVPNSTTSGSPQQIMPYGNNALIQPKESEKRLIERKDDNSKFVDVTPFLTLPQHEAAKKLGIPSSTLAKRWKEASCNRKWPYRTVSKLDKEILTLLKNVENAKAELSPSVEATLGLLLKKRQEELKTVLVRL